MTAAVGPLATRWRGARSGPRENRRPGRPPRGCDRLASHPHRYDVRDGRPAWEQRPVSGGPSDPPPDRGGTRIVGPLRGHGPPHALPPALEHDVTSAGCDTRSHGGRQPDLPPGPLYRASVDLEVQAQPAAPLLHLALLAAACLAPGIGEGPSGLRDEFPREPGGVERDRQHPERAVVADDAVRQRW